MLHVVEVNLCMPCRGGDVDEDMVSKRLRLQGKRSIVAKNSVDET